MWEIVLPLSGCTHDGATKAVSEAVCVPALGLALRAKNFCGLRAAAVVHAARRTEIRSASVRADLLSLWPGIPSSGERTANRAGHVRRSKRTFQRSTLCLTLSPPGG